MPITLELNSQRNEVFEVKRTKCKHNVRTMLGTQGKKNERMDEWQARYVCIQP